MEIKELFQKFYPNAEFKIMELCPYYDSAKSFYGKAKVIATPTLSIANNEVSRIFIGEEKPITTGVTMEPVMGTIDGMTSTIGYTVEPQIEMTPIGTTLVIAPNINADRSVMLRLMQEESSVRKNGGSIPYGNASSLQTYSVDTIQSRRISGTFITQDGLLAGIGGLITETESEQNMTTWTPCITSLRT